MKSLRTFLSAAVLALALAAPASAQIMNGDFSAGPADWNFTTPPNWAVGVLAAGGNPDAYGRIQSPFGNSGGTGSIFQTFICGDPVIPGNCVISLDYYLDQIDASPLTGRVIILVDGAVLYTSPPGPTTGWVSIILTVPCGVHVLSLDLEVDPGNNGWAACFDNVTARCEPIVGTSPTTWGRIKSLIIS